MNTHSIDPAAFQAALNLVQTASGAAAAKRQEAAELEIARERGLLTLLLMADLLAS
jgi:hypothetical protein